MEHLDLTTQWVGIAALCCFAIAYAVAMSEERLQVRKSVPVLVAALVIWILVGIGFTAAGAASSATDLALHTLLEFAELLLFLIPAMTFVNTLQDRGVFDVLRVWLVRRGLSLRALFWVTGALAFVLSPIADNLTTALIMGAVVMAVGRGHPRFIALACINIVVAANAGGAFSPFGDITTLMVWQAGHVPFSGFFAILLPSVVNWLVPAVCLSFAIRGGQPSAVTDWPKLEPGALPVLVLFLTTIAMTVLLHNYLGLPPAVGMMGGLALLKAYSSIENTRHTAPPEPEIVDELNDVFARADWKISKPLDIFAMLEKVEWDTLMFFYGVLMAVGGLGAMGYLALTSQALYGTLGATAANVLVGLLSAVIDNVPVMFAVLQMSPEMSRGQWLLVTLTTGVGGSLLSIGSAAGVALMGQARGIYTFGAHLRWIWAIALGYAASIATHLWLNADLFAFA
jgi:Na+/H+ antiporter NhaD/arsenite permease-like protein